jgi:ATP/maltotriose-dependent transcriptional regulator MalT
VRHGRAAVVAGRAAQDDVALAAALDGLKTAYAYSGDVAALAPVLAELEPLLRRQGDLWRLQWTLLESAFPAVAAGDWAGALDRIDAGRVVNRRSRYGSYDAWFVLHRGWVQRLCGRREEALASGREAVAVAAAQGGHPWWSASAHGFLGGVLLEAGDRPAAVRELTAAVRHAERSRAEAHLLRGLASLAEATGDRDQLGRAADLLAEVTAPSGGWLLGADAYLAVARGWLAAGEPGRAGEVLAPFRAAAERAGWLPLQALAAEVAAAVATASGDPATAAAERSRARTLADRHGVALPARRS